MESMLSTIATIGQSTFFNFSPPCFLVNTI
uniref:Uncharacterized protein n=1 Tax=Siphoviridae sp. ctyNQ5 TaxID=2825745 RepID=A0A8S5QBJ3_9CAUD|nr:MAG TPA: hypothetical protein [Siphoviridae sp. ctyNQ5]DAK54739.1 MAG TPA: hypothetical protein [Bacteriophage sp.]DAZ69398.1 MAG TPA: hypothetical protein [Caudoviricetes sp.]